LQEAPILNIKKIAEMCDISTSTVSRILNNKPDVNHETRDRVISMMNEIGFRPTVVTNRNETIGVVTPVVAWPEFMGELMNGIMDTVYSHGKHLTLIPMRGKSLNEVDDISHFCRSNGLCGMMVINPPSDSKLPKGLVDHEIPHVIIAASYRDTNISWVDVDNIGGCINAVNHLIHQGHRRIALFHNIAANPCELDRIQGYKEALIINGIQTDNGLMVEMNNHMDLSEQILQLMSKTDRPTAIFCTTYRGTLGVFKHLQKLNISVPDNISIVGFGDYDVSPLTNPPMTTVHQPIYEMGKIAAEIFEQLINQKHYKNIQRLLPTQLMIRNSSKSIV
jgi:LacI family transcriptional regulator